jgi:hypothetical protein
MWATTKTGCRYISPPILLRGCLWIRRYSSGSGLISGVNSCGDVSIALKFTEASGEGFVNVADLLRTSISLDARKVGGGEEWQSGEKVSAAAKPEVWATSRDMLGNLAGADIAFVVCPDHPKCKKYPTCPCPEPPPNKP